MKQDKVSYLSRIIANALNFPTCFVTTGDLEFSNLKPAHVVEIPLKNFLGRNIPKVFSKYFR